MTACTSMFPYVRHTHTWLLKPCIVQIHMHTYLNASFPHVWPTLHMHAHTYLHVCFPDRNTLVGWVAWSFSSWTNEFASGAQSTVSANTLPTRSESTSTLLACIPSALATSVATSRLNTCVFQACYAWYWTPVCWVRDCSLLSGMMWPCLSACMACAIQVLVCACECVHM
jgi:hypothetical protein